ncbi:hypothetical protein DFH08DRAFT_857128 [Mycena albidolilacea]|uniref:Cytochrome P450 n=1 Tax=Mycena albidolilacea TaxID=1033008 RepID=A0AAD7AAM0_9AGAR|nr:hypothetical protein DFH08DRAFT_857128 [Mycena albidolilacea]
MGIKYKARRSLLVDQTLKVLFAGRDTTAATITFLTHCLATHPPVLERLREEILAQIGEADTPTFEDPGLNACYPIW